MFENEEIGKDKGIKITHILYILMLLVVIVGGSYAVFTTSFGGIKDVLVDTNDLIFNYNETSDSIILTDATSYTDSEGLINGGTFTFDVSASSTKEQNVYYTIYLTEESTNTMDSSYIKLALLDNNNNTLVSATSYKNLRIFSKKENARILYTNEINLPTQNNVKQNYVLKYWVDSKIEELTTTTEGNKQTVSLNGGEFKFKVNVMRKGLTGAEMLIKKVGTDGLVAESHPATEQLIATTDYRYTGANPNNYVSFNNELWRIIGVFDVDNGTGNLEQRIKIIRNGWAKTNVVWDSDDESDWSKASVMTLLNSGEYWNRTGESASNGLTPEAKSLIADAKWYLGGEDDYEISSSALASHFYSYERGITVYEGHPTSWIGKVGLMYPSDYGYATSGGTTTNRGACLAKEMYKWNDSSVSDCKNNDWLYDSDRNQWTITPSSNVWAFVMWSSGYVGTYRVTSTWDIRPVVYLSSDIEITGGTGTESDPYTLS